MTALAVPAPVTVTADDSAEQAAREASRLARRKRYRLQRAAASILERVPHPRGGIWRTRACAVDVQTGVVGVRYSDSSARSSYSGLRLCGSGWVCPVCASKIAEHRRVEIACAHAVHAAAGGTALLVTLTVPHVRVDALGSLLGGRAEGRVGLAGAMQRLKNSRVYKVLARELGRVGHIRATEITYGAHGWHPHYHELWLCSAEQTERVRARTQRTLSDIWRRACVASGLAMPSRQRGVDVRWADDVSAYLVKAGQTVDAPALDADAIAQAERSRRWSAARELASSQSKSAKRGSRSPMQLLEDAAAGDDIARRAWSEFAAATYGKNVLRWQRGLKSALAIPERTDDELAALGDEDSYFIAAISAERWRAMLRLPYDARAAMLELAESGGPDALHDFLDLVQIDPDRARVSAGID